jgi:hypothetical protein
MSARSHPIFLINLATTILAAPVQNLGWVYKKEFTFSRTNPSMDLPILLASRKRR